MTCDSLTENEEHDMPSQILKTIFGLHASVIFSNPNMGPEIPNSSGQLAELIVYNIPPEYICIVTWSYYYICAIELVAWWTFWELIWVKQISFMSNDWDTCKKWIAVDGLQRLDWLVGEQDDSPGYGHQVDQLSIEIRTDRIRHCRPGDCMCEADGRYKYRHTVDHLRAEFVWANDGKCKYIFSFP